MKFSSGFNTAVYVIRPQVVRHDEWTGQPKTIREAIRAHFIDHLFDSEIAQKAHGWTDEQREKVEEYLLTHPDMGRVDGRGLTKVEDAPVGAIGTLTEETTCRYFRDVDGEVLKCPKPVSDEDPLNMYCALHMEKEEVNA